MINISSFVIHNVVAISVQLIHVGIYFVLCSIAVSATTFTKYDDKFLIAVSLF